MIEVLQSMIQKKAQEYCSLRHFIISYTLKSAWSLERNLTFNHGTRKGCGTLRGLEEGGKGIGTGVRTSGKILGTRPLMLVMKLLANYKIAASCQTDHTCPPSIKSNTTDNKNKLQNTVMLTRFYERLFKIYFNSCSSSSIHAFFCICYVIYT